MKEPDCDRPGDVTRLARGACHVDQTGLISL